MEKEFEVVIVGGGLVGSLAALKFAKRGFNVRLFEKRTDIRKDSTVSGRSINLALSHRGLEALEGIPLNGNLIPMKGRMIHPKTGPTSSQLYGVFGEVSFSKLGYQLC
jgi:kynurenine 3-monooxygenase